MSKIEIEQLPQLDFGYKYKLLMKNEQSLPKIKQFLSYG